MKINRLAKALLGILFLLVFIQSAKPCSLYKVTSNGKTILGNNEDSWGTDPCIWFMQAKKGVYGVACVGYQKKFPNPDGAMNEMGLAFDAFSMPHLDNLPEPDPQKKDFSYSMILSLMQTCKNVEEVYSKLLKYNLHALNGSPIFHGGMLLFADKTGKYLVVEASKMSIGNDSAFALANFSYSTADSSTKNQFERYRKGMLFLNNKPLQTNLTYCTSLSDTMSVSRAKIGDGTLYTNILDLQEGLIHLYFFHDFRNKVSFTLSEELAKPDHFMAMSDLFPNHASFKRFKEYKTPANNSYIFAFLLFSIGFLIFSSIYLMVSFIKKFRGHFQFNSYQLLISFCGLMYAVYFYILIRNEGIFYFPSPYKDPHSLLVNLSSYLPYCALFLMPSSWLMLFKAFKSNEWKTGKRIILAGNSLVLTVMLVFFFYWKLI